MTLLSGKSEDSLGRSEIIALDLARGRLDGYFNRTYTQNLP